MLEEKDMASYNTFEKLEYVKKGIEIIFTCIAQYAALQEDTPESSEKLYQTCPSVYEKLIQ